MVATLIFSVVSACDDVPPDSKYTCHQQAVQWSKCNEPWMKDKCNKSCGRCPTESKCDDVPPDSKYTCHQQAVQWSKCNEPWMKNYCKRSCGKCGSSATRIQDGRGTALQGLGINAPADINADLKPYPHYKNNKPKIVAALRASGMTKAEQTMCLAIAMLETSTFDPADRDNKKTGEATNWSSWNINTDMAITAGRRPTAVWNQWSGLDAVCSALKAMIRKYGVNGFLNFLRGGSTGWKDGTSFDCAGYRNGIASIVKQIDANPSLWHDNRRVDLHKRIGYVG